MTSNVVRLISAPDPDSASTLHEVVAKRVGAILGENGISRLALAHAIGISGPGLSMKLNGQRPIDLEDLQAIATALDVEPSDLLARRSPRPVGPAAGASGGARLPQMDSNHQPSD